MCPPDIDRSEPSTIYCDRFEKPVWISWAPVSGCSGRSVCLSLDVIFLSISEERRSTRTVVEEQDAAYLESLRIDREKEERRKAEEEAADLARQQAEEEMLREQEEARKEQASEAARKQVESRLYYPLVIL